MLIFWSLFHRGSFKCKKCDSFLYENFSPRKNTYSDIFYTKTFTEEKNTYSDSFYTKFLPRKILIQTGF